MKKQYKIDSKGFTKGIGSSAWKKNNDLKIKQLKLEIAQLQKLKDAEQSKLVGNETQSNPDE